MGEVFNEETFLKGAVQIDYQNLVSTSVQFIPIELIDIYLISRSCPYNTRLCKLNTIGINIKLIRMEVLGVFIIV